MKKPRYYTILEPYKPEICKKIAKEVMNLKMHKTVARNLCGITVSSRTEAAAATIIIAEKKSYNRIIAQTAGKRWKKKKTKYATG